MQEGIAVNTANIISSFNAKEFIPEKARGVESVLNAVMIANGSSWESEFKCLLQVVKRLYLMPNDIKCVKAYLAANAFIQQPGITKRVRINDVISCMNYACYNGQEAIVALHGTPTEYVLISSTLPKDTTSGLDKTSRYQAYGYRNPAYRTDIANIWVRWQDRDDHSPIRRKARASQAPQKHILPADHECFHFCQKNPKESTGDCVIRAIASACNLSWEETIDRLTEGTNYLSTTVNAPEIYEAYLKQTGFERRSAMLQNGKKLDGNEFCKELDKVLRLGETVFANVGRSHVAAVLPFKENGVTHYKIVDSWDSTSRKIGEYWIKPVPAHDAISAAKEECSIASVIVHPVFGTGRVISLHALGWATVLFPQHGERRLGIRWILQNCNHLDTTG